MSDKTPFLSQCTSGGCGAKIAASDLSDLLKHIPKTPSPNLLVGFDASDDAAVYRIDENTSLISTVDFFSPMVEDPHTFGRIAAANALSDVYAMGGTPILALNLVCFPEKLDNKILGEILAGGAEKVSEADAVIGGGHSIYDHEPKYGLAVTGTVLTNQIIRNNTPKIGDLLILTKPLGTGIVMAAARVNLANESALKTATDSMQQLNRYAAEKMANYTVNACTDVTGFGFLSHLSEMCGERVTAKIYIRNLPIIPEASAYAAGYLLTAAGQRNRMAFGDKGEISALPFAIQEILFDPQTSGGLLISVNPNEASALLSNIQENDPSAQIVGEILPKQKDTILFS